MVVKARPSAEKKQSDTERVVKTSPRYGKLTPTQVKRAVARVSRDVGRG